MIRLPGVRWQIAVLLCLITTVNYIDRQACAVAGPVIAEEFSLTNTEFGLIVSGFLFAYAIGQLLVGPVIDRLGTKRAFSIAVVACSALTAASREILGTDRAGIALIHLSGPPSLIAARVAARADAGSHYMPAALLPSQFDALEPPEDAFVVDIALPPEQIVGLIRQGLAEYERPDETADNTAGDTA